MLFNSIQFDCIVTYMIYIGPLGKWEGGDDRGISSDELSLQMCPVDGKDSNYTVEFVI